jgi:transposase
VKPESPYVGIDVSKDQLDIALRPTGDTWSMPNDASGITEAVQRLAQLYPKLVILEATGGLQMPLAAALASAGLSFGHGESPSGPRLRQGRRQAGQD